MIALISSLAWADPADAFYIDEGESAKVSGPVFVVPEPRMDALLAKALAADQMSTDLLKASELLYESSNSLRGLAVDYERLVREREDARVDLAEIDAKLRAARRQRNTAYGAVAGVCAVGAAAFGLALAL